MFDPVHGRPDILLIQVAEEAQEEVGSPPTDGRSPAITFVGFETPPDATPPEPVAIPSSDLDLFG
jgi:hypothetical protein